MAIRTNSLAFRLVAGAAFWVAAGLLAGAFLLSTIFRDYAQRSFDAQLAVLFDSLYTVSRLDEQGRLELLGEPGEPAFDQPLSGWYWQIMKDKRVLWRSRSLWDQSLKIEKATDKAQFFVVPGPDEQRLRMIVQNVRVPDARGRTRAVFTMVVAGNADQIEAEIEIFNRSLAWSLGGLGLLLIIAVFIQVRFGLMPLRRISRSLAAIRSGRSDRLDGQFPSEVEPLAEELNKLIDANKEIVERARTHVGNLAHALKTPIAVLANESGDRDDHFAGTVREQTQVMQEQVEHHLARARAAASATALGARTEVRLVLDALKRTLSAIHRDRDLTIAVEAPRDAAVACERQDVDEMLGNLMDNACKWAKSTVGVSVEPKGKTFVITVQDDGPGLTPEERISAVRRGKRLDEAKPGSGLGLAIVRDLVESYGGTFEMEEADLGGLAAVLTLPSAG